MYHDGYYPQMMSQGDGWIGLIWGLLMLVVFVSLIIILTRALGKGVGHHYHDHRDPLDIARERYARGDIDKGQLAEIRKELTRKD